jgi:hypothetical protein
MACGRTPRFVLQAFAAGRSEPADCGVAEDQARRHVASNEPHRRRRRNRPNSAVRLPLTAPPARRSHCRRAIVPTAAGRRCLCLRKDSPGCERPALMQRRHRRSPCSRTCGRSQRCERDHAAPARATRHSGPVARSQTRRRRRLIAAPDDAACWVITRVSSAVTRASGRRPVLSGRPR